jgi:hypothetical protein
MGIVAAGPIGYDGRIQKFTTAGALPGVKGTYKVIELLGEHSTSAAWTLHGNPPVDDIN